jgi:hypothetical protein
MRGTVALRYYTGKMDLFQRKRNMGYRIGKVFVRRPGVVSGFDLGRLALIPAFSRREKENSHPMIGNGEAACPV